MSSSYECQTEKWISLCVLCWEVNKSEFCAQELTDVSMRASSESTSPSGPGWASCSWLEGTRSWGWPDTCSGAGSCRTVWVWSQRRLSSRWCRCRRLRDQTQGRAPSPRQGDHSALLKMMPILQTQYINIIKHNIYITQNTHPHHAHSLTYSPTFNRHVNYFYPVQPQNN